ncbi:hypothetical protein [Phenylobacterium sp.]|uniref:phage adaptor protein n=1 Tax=Phenylobacterium sp. TaxID=1871053 RepID=UPI0030F44194
MALSTYAELKAAIADWLERGDLADRTSDFIALAESRLNRVLRLRMMETEEVLTTTIGARTVTLPAAFREPIALWLQGPSGRTPLRFVDPAALSISTAAGGPQAWTLNAGAIAFDRPCDRAYSLALRMVGRLALSDAQPGNAVLTDYPDLYLFGALVEAAPYLRDAELLSLFMARFEAALTEARAKEARGKALATLGVEPLLLASGA